MTGPATGEPDRSDAAPMRTSGTRNAASAILILLAVGFVLRLIIAYILPGSGFRNDLDAFRFWAQKLAELGPGGFYHRDFFIDYTPGYLYALWAIGIVERVVPSLDLIKIPAILADIGVAWLIWSMVQELGGGRRAALTGAAIYLFVPVTWFDSVVWGQVDSVGLVFVLLAVRSLWRDRPELAVVFTVIAGIVKIQLGVILVPITAAVLLRRYLWDSQQGSGDAAGRVRGPARLLTSFAAGIGTAAILGAPFSLSILDLISQVFKTAGGYPYLTVNAYNPWALVTRAGAGLAQSGQWLCDSVTGTAPDAVCPPGSETLVGAFWASFVGDGVLVIIAVLIAVMIARRPDRQSILVGLAVLAIAFFVVPTRVHERYMFPFFAVAAILAAVSWRWLVAYVALAAAAFLNMYVVLTTLYPDNPKIADWLGIGPTIRGFAGVATIAAVHAIGLIWAAFQLRTSSREALEDEIADSGEPAPPPPRPRPARAIPAVAPPVPAAAGAWLPSPPVAGIGPAWSGAGAGTGVAASAGPQVDRPSAIDRAPPNRPYAEEPRWPPILDPLIRRLSASPLRADRSRLLDHEGGGRLDRLDLWLLVWLVIASLVLRMWRLAEPASMHFDEVYHARTATEFLQDWRYGLPQYVYEWTHPHLAKYAMALGIVAWGDDRVNGQSALGVPVLDAAIEPRWDDPRLPDHRAGDRLYVATSAGSGGIRVFDLANRQLITTIALPGITNVAVDTTGHQLFAVTGDGQAFVVDTSLALDPLRTGSSAAGLAPPAAVGSFGTAVKKLISTSDGGFLVAISKGDDVISLDQSTGAVRGRVHLAGAADMTSAGKVDGLVADPAAITDPAAVAKTLVGLIGGDVRTIQAKLAGTGGQVVVAGSVDATKRAAVDAAIAAGRLDGLTFQQLSVVAVADSDGVAMVSPADGSVGDVTPISGGATGLVLTSNLDAPRLYVATGPTLTILKLSADGTTHVSPLVETSIRMPGPVSKVTFDAASVNIHALGTAPDGGASTIYVVEPHANAVYADARLPNAPLTWVTDVQPDYPSADRQTILTFDAAGDVASVDIGMHEFSWRVPGVIAGAITAGLLFLLTRLIFRRRLIGVLVAILALADGMLFVQSRIAMNDVYVGLFLLAAYVLFAGLWTGRWRFRGAFWVLMPAIGLLLGLALASKWVAAYAIAAMGLLILIRSALGRTLTILALIAATVYLGYQGLIVASAAPGEVIRSGPNFLFMFLMIGLTLLATIVTILHPVAWSTDEVRFAIGAPAGLGILIGLVAIPLGVASKTYAIGPVSITPLTAALSLILLGILVFAGFALAGRFGFGPLAPPLAPDDPARLAEPPAEPPASWLRLGSYMGVSAAWLGLCLVLLPVALYAVSYIPWALDSGPSPVGVHQIFPPGTPLIGAWPPETEALKSVSHQTLWQLTQSMYDYHNNLRAPHAAASPWWAWPFDLKPVWFYQGSFAGDTSAAIYDAGNLAIWWLGVPAMGFIAWQAFKRRSLALAMIAVGFAFQWLSWSRIDRATFQYHYYTSVPFIVLGLAYLLAELWNGPSPRTWLLARASGVAAILGPGLMWAFKTPLCALIDVDRAYKDSPACVGNPANLLITDRVAVTLIVLVAAVVFIVFRVARLSGPAERDGRAQRDEILQIAVAAVVAAVVVQLAAVLLGDRVLVDIKGLSTGWLAVAGVHILGGIAWFVATARDARRFVLGALVAVVGVFIAFYPNIAAVPMPSTFFNIYQGLLPTYLYPFQFPVNTDPVPAKMASVFAADPGLFGLPPALVLGGVLLIACGVVAYSAWSWRVAARAPAPPDGRP